MLIYRKKLYIVGNKDDQLEEHFKEVHLTFKNKNQSPLVMITKEFYYRILYGADIIWMLR